MTDSASSEIQLDDDGMNNMFKESNDQNGETQKEANTSSKVDIDQLVIDIKNSSEGSDPKSDSSTKPCIYMVPGHLRKVNAKAYTPTLISIGPFHHRDFRFKTMEKLKLRYVKRFRDREESAEPDLLNRLLNTIDDKKEDIRSCYSDSFGFADDYFVKMILVDAIFILELFLSCFPKTDKSNQENHDSTNSIKAEPWMLSAVTLDLVLLENQLPFSIIKVLYDNYFSTKQKPTLIQLIFEFFKDFNVQNMKHEGFEVEIKHFTDLLRTFYLHAPPTSSKSKRCNCFNLITGKPASKSITSNEWPPRKKVRKLLYSATQLHEAGVKFELSNSKCLLDLDFDYTNGVLKIPGLELNDSAEARIRNVMAYEQFDLGEKTFITDYLIILDFLINTPKDMDLLCDKEIVVNYLGDDKVATSVVNRLNTNVSWLGIDSKYRDICEDLNRFGKNPRHRWIAILRHEYFNTPWRGAATIAAIILLLLTLIQSVCSIFQVV
ncbi:hypothetical protein CMV_022303 [Castanea mollissima]|uniref:Uncharacterized protein n=1 Tax=Castanea mollissima TaxID=60419 RepID=A0A8J4QT31_9ROSI|nr:hypothetical protein CMV_022303 [Castanea mollissima]